MKSIQIPLLLILFVFCFIAGPVQGKEPPRQISFRIVADIDGSDRLSISWHEVLWIHRHWDWPDHVRINEFDWQPRHSPVLGEGARESLFAAPVDFSSARMTVHQGRDTVVMETFDDHVVIHYADSPNGRSTYDVTVTFDVAIKKHNHSHHHTDGDSSP